MNDNTETGDGPISTAPTGNPDLGMPGDTPLANIPAPVSGSRPPDEGDTPATVAPAEAEPDPEQAIPEPPAPPAEAPREPRRLSRGERDMVDRVRQRFAACGRCGYHIADLQLLLGEEALQTASIQSKDGWLRLEGDERLRQLLINAYGVRLDMGYDAMDGACPECRRRFVFAALDDGQVRLKLRT